ncbi:hypothetical protein HBI23_168910 [Parastagonospora nodorum]|nr:hypothetical protein HBI47_031910 [Parastagonospora nodorum]KAH5651613.1 hypothetical protein HBI23_168910 [Parastagonospora nodorum]
MAAFGRLTASGVTGINENTLALVNFNVDFSLLKVTPPQEFLDVGNSLSSRRKQEAEEGRIHQTARRLGIIFESLLPPTPQLIRRYGTRASEIAQRVTARAPKAGGLFSNQVGVDGASIWAAATSSSGALQVHLLACMLARMWDQAEAISIWEELLKSREAEVKDTLQQDGDSSMAVWSALASLQSITRKQLGEWDSSARSWLRTADRSPIVLVRQNQLDWIISQARNQVNDREVLYGSVMETWKTALIGVEQLLAGSPQEMQTGEILLGLHAWHLYPDINLLDHKDMIDFSDPLVPKGGILTIGLVRNTEATLSGGLHWSLPLAHLRYYGDPIKRTGKLSGVQNRISLPEFMQTVLGILMKLWNVGDSAMEETLRWICLLHELVSTAMRSRAEKETPYAKNNWLALLSRAVIEFLDSKGDRRLLNKRLINAGRVHGSRKLLGRCTAPYFGLSQTHHIFQLLKTQEGKIKFLRDLMQNQPSFDGELIIRYMPKGTDLEEFASVFPNSYGRTAKRSHDGKIIQYNGVHSRWTKCKVYERLQKYDETGLALPAMAEGSTDHKFEARARLLEGLGEDIRAIKNAPFETLQMNNEVRVVWGESRVLSNLNEQEKAKAKWEWIPPFGKVIHYSLLLGDPTDVALFLRMSQREPRIPESMDFCILKDMIRGGDVNMDLLPAILYEAVTSSSDQCARSLSAVATMHQIYTLLPGATLAIKILESKEPLLNAVWLPNSIAGPSNYSHLNRHKQDKRDVTDDQLEHDVKISQHFDEAFADVARAAELPSQENTAVFRKSTRSLLESFKASFMNPFELSVTQSLSCILYFDSGTFNIPASHMDEIMAISSGDSLFIAAPLLSDPAERGSKGSKIKHIMGNIGRAGTALLKPPDNPRVRTVGVEHWYLISGENWDGERRDAFQDTSLHLWFTGSSLAIDRKKNALGEKDVELYMLQSVVSVHGRGTKENGEWMADLDIMKALRDPALHFQTLFESCAAQTTIELEAEQCMQDSKTSLPLPEQLQVGAAYTSAQDPLCMIHMDSTYESSKLELLAVENWMELLHTQTNSCIFLAQGNWQARQAATAVSMAKGRKTCILSEKTCWACIADQFPYALKDGQMVTFIA